MSCCSWFSLLISSTLIWNLLDFLQRSSFWWSGWIRFFRIIFFQKCWEFWIFSCPMWSFPVLGSLEHLLELFLFPWCVWWGIHLMLWMKQNLQTAKDRECSVQEIFDICIQCKPFWQCCLQWLGREYINIPISQIKYLKAMELNFGPDGMTEKLALLAITVWDLQ